MVKTSLTTTTLILGVLGMVAVAAVPARAVIISDFDPGGTYFGGVEGWFNYGGLPSVTATAAPGGTSLWLGVKPNQYYGNITAQNWAIPGVTNADLNTNTNLEFDLIVGTDWLPAGFTMSVEMQVGGGVGGTINKYLTYSNPSVAKATVIHVNLPYAAVLPVLDPTATFYNLSLNASPGYDYGWDGSNPSVVPYDAHWYVDNIQLTTGVAVPEPTTLGLVAAGGLLAMLRRRRAAALC